MIDAFPDVVRIEPAGICNIACRHCPVGREGGKRGLMSLDDFIKAFRPLAYTTRVLVLYHGGEPLLNRDLLRMVDIAKIYHVCKVVLNTNGILLNPEHDYSGIDDMRVSFYGSAVNENDNMRFGSSFADIALNVTRMLKHKPPKQVTIYDINGLGRPADYLLEAFEDCNVVFRNDRMKHWARVKDTARPLNGVRYCPNLWETFTILANGDVVMCCEDLMGDEFQGNVFAESAYDVWRRMQAVRDDFARGDYPELCKRCYRVTG